MSLESRLEKLANPNTSAKEKRKIMDQLQEETTTTKSSALGAAAGGVGAGLLSTVAGAAIMGALLKTKRFKGLRKTIEDGAEGTIDQSFVNDLKAGSPIYPEWFNKMMIKPKGEALQKDLDAGKMREVGVEQARDIGGMVTGALGGMVGASYGGSHFGEKTGPSEQATAALERMAASGKVSKQDLERYKRYYQGIQDSRGSMVAEQLANIGVQVPMALAFGAGAGERVGRMVAPDLNKSKIFKTHTGRALAGEELGDIILGNPLAGAAGSAAYNATSDPYTDPF